MAVQRNPSSIERSVSRYRAGQWSCDSDSVPVEEPLEIRLLWQQDGQTVRRNIAVTMRTPGDDFALAAGFLHGEGILAGVDDVVDISYCADEAEEQAFNIVLVTLRPGLVFDATRLERNFLATSSCGVCGKASLEALEVHGCLPVDRGFTMAADLLGALPGRLREAQILFGATGGVHAAGLFTPGGSLVAVKEDVGRHNAVDKVIGEQFLAGAMPLADRLLMLSGRAGFELVQKALVARIPLVAAVGAPTSLAVQLAEAFGITLAGFVSPGGANVYTGKERITG